MTVMVVVCLTGCKSPGYKKADAAALNSQAAVASVQAESTELHATIEALNDLVNQPAEDIKPQFLTFDHALTRLASSTRHAETEVNRVWSQWDAYFDLWEKEILTIQDPAMQNLSDDRKTEVSNQYIAAKRRYAETGNIVQPLIVYLQDIRKTLSTDLTRDGLMTIKPSVSTANQRAQQVETALVQSVAELDALSARTASYRVQGAPATK